MTKRAGTRRKALERSFLNSTSAREPARPPDRMVSVSKESRVWLRRICSLSSSIRCSRSFSRTAYVAPSTPLEAGRGVATVGPAAAGDGPAAAAEDPGAATPPEAAGAAEAEAAGDTAFLVGLPPGC